MEPRGGAARPRRLSIEQLADDVLVASMLHLPEFADDIDAPVTPQGLPAAGLIPRLPDGLIEQLVEALRHAPEDHAGHEVDLVEMAVGHDRGGPFGARRASAGWPRRAC